MYPYYVYMLTNIKQNVMYVGVTNDLGRRVHEHRQGMGGTFTRRYHAKALVYAEEHDSIDDAIAREKQTKGWSRAKQNSLVEASNPTWADLADTTIAKDPSLRSG